MQFILLNRGRDDVILLGTNSEEGAGEVHDFPVSKDKIRGCN